MVGFGLIDEWEPAPGELVTWTASQQAVTAAAQAPPHPAPPSHQQEEYLWLAHRHAGADFRFSGLCVVSAEFPGSLDRELMTNAVNTFLRRHDTFRTWFSVESGGRFQRHMVAPEVVDFEPCDYGDIDSAQAIRAHVEKTTPGPFNWDCFTFGAIERGDSTTFYLAIDHLHIDGIGLYVACYELIHLYAGQIWDDLDELRPGASFVNYCAQERAYTASLTPASPGVRKWLELVRGNAGELPSFPLALGRQTVGYNRSAHLTVPLCDEADAARFEADCRAGDATFAGGLFAVAALAERALTGSGYYFGMSPITTRGATAEFFAVGWYVTLIPVAFPIGRDTTFDRLVRRAQRAYEHGLRLAPTSFHRVLELAADDPEIKVFRGWSTSMISYIDARDFVGNEIFEAAHGIYANRAATEQVLIWINRFPTGTSLSVIFPDTPVAHESVRRYTDTLRTVFATVIGGGS